MKTNQELYNDFFNKIDTDETSILTLIRSQYEEWYTFATNKRLELQANYELYKNIKEGKEEIGDETTYSTVNALMARGISEEFRGEFEANSTRDQIIVDNLNATLQQDYDNDDMLAVDLYGMFYKYVMWIYIKINTEWNGKIKTPVFNYVDPRIWIPDPNGDYATGKYAYSGFETFIGKYSIDKDWLDAKLLQPLNQGYGTSSMQKYRDQQLVNLQNVGTIQENPYYDIYYHYFTIEDKKWKTQKACAVVGNNKTLLLRIEIIEAPSKDIDAEFPFSFEYFGFEPNNPYGDNVCNHTADPQKIKALMRDLRVRKAKAELYPMYFYNDKYLDKNKLAFGFNKFIPVSTKQDGAVSLDSIITSFKPDSRADNSYIIDQDLDKQIERATSIGANITGSTQDKLDATATEAWIVQTNSDINIAYREKIANIGKKQFIRVWLQAYMKNFTEWDKKLVMMYNWIGSTPVELTKKDFLLASYNKIRVRSRTQLEISRKKEALALSQLTNLVMSMENIDNYQKILILRDYAEALGYDKNKIHSRLSAWPEEELIKQENGILEAWLEMPTNPEDNHLMHIILQKPNENSTIQAITHWQTHLAEWVAGGKPIATSANGTQQAIQASMASSNTAQMNAQPSIPNQ